ncbi:hypothetical protein [Pseudorhodoferax soli]|uniref:Uncharacterized protein n=1 Tax=Pseudorhodoferax soli TaxID=545864 RepID=A0A368XGN1_9BURK|nr:hypothetical protein [Pseudorhodoferax soli]PZP98252.1 MAG: hypothetical protein DI583_14440 [Variovorax paradoxus]PZQ09613.1 MAG: hypothetical protein DI587_14440 [Variovorax paradoxus]RCW66178.1 hypothetical protein DES41_111136 [Pseudorhodoferax soli]
MKAVKQASHWIASRPEADGSIVVADLIIALESKQPFEVHRLSGLDDEHFALTLGILEDWRSVKRQAGKSKLLDLALQLRALKATTG